MKNPGFRNVMTWLHTWSGLLPGWVLYAIFITGTASYFRPEITAWMQPEAPRLVSVAHAGEHALAHLQKVAPDARRWGAELPDTRSGTLRVYWQDAGRRFQNARLDPVSGGNDAARATSGGEFFYRFHFQLMLPYPWGRYLACVAAMFLLVALASGVVAHRRLLKDMFLFRRTKDGRRPWLDFHNVTAVVALPFYVLIGYSALVIFAPLVMPWATKVLGSAPKPVPPVAGAAAEVAPLAAAEPVALFRAAVAHWGEARSVRRIEVNDRGGPNATITFTRADGPAVSLRDRETLVFSAVTGERIDDAKSPGVGERVNGWLYGFHLARFAGPALRAAFFFMGLLGAAMIGTGLALWTLKRRERLRAAGRGGRFGHWLVARLNLAVIAGLPLACAAFFWANRILPAGLAGREKWEVNAVLAIWAAAALHACVRPERKGWREQLRAGAFAFGALPVLDLVTAGRQVAAWPRFDALHVGFTLSFIALAALFAHGARKLSRPASAREGSS